MLVAATCLLTFGVFVPFLGIYYDDFVSFYILERFGVDRLLDLVWGQARPVFAFLFWLPQNNVLIAHTLMLGFHIANGLLLLSILRRAVPKLPLLGTLVAVLYAVYPLYWLRPTVIALAIDGAASLFLLSVALGLHALRFQGTRRGLLALASLILMPIYFFSYELMFPLELFRPLLFWLVIGSNGQTDRLRWRRVVIGYLPWFLMTAALGIYRLLIFEATGFYANIDYNSPEIPTSLDAAFNEFARFIPLFQQELVGTWLYHVPNALSGGVLPLLAGVAIAAALVAYAIRFRSVAVGSSGNLRRVLLLLFLSGIAVMVAGQLTTWVSEASRLPTVEGIRSRWHLASSIGVCIAWAAAALFLASFISRKHLPAVASLLLAPMIVVGSALHIRNSQDFVTEWRQELDVWWQLAWRVQDLKEGTLVILPSQTWTARNSATFLYEPLIQGDLFFDNPTIVGGRLTRELLRNRSYVIDNGNWQMRWEWEFENAILLYVNAAGCVDIIDPTEPLPEGVSLSPAEQELLAVLPDPDTRIELASDDSFPSRRLFQPEPPRSACYAYQQAARQEFDRTSE